MFKRIFGHLSLSIGRVAIRKSRKFTKNLRKNCGMQETWAGPLTKSFVLLSYFEDRKQPLLESKTIELEG